MKFAAENWDERRKDVEVVVDAARKHVVAIGREMAMRSDASSRVHIKVGEGAIRAVGRM
jgi:hypothetical protein